jgi:hypothetical protein
VPGLWGLCLRERHGWLRFLQARAVIVRVRAQGSEETRERGGGVSVRIAYFCWVTEKQRVCVCTRQTLSACPPPSLLPGSFGCNLGRGDGSSAVKG